MLSPIVPKYLRYSGSQHWYDVAKPEGICERIYRFLIGKRGDYIELRFDNDQLVRVRLLSLVRHAERRRMAREIELLRAARAR
jgi:hypothetical protein